ncbi:ommochrome-binding protein-like [Epargyreus clarus]|uniref:ommochrome-binding protein-like n=1 Tax=Epargyreus clarus TaxID=520877 RepID=UPI003C2C2995
MKTDVTMLLAFLLASIATASAKTNCTTCITVEKNDNTTCYNTTFLLELDAPFRNEVVIHKLGILRSTNVLFFSFEPTLTDPEYYKIGYINLDNPGNVSVISGGKKIMNFGAFDIDQANALIYLGGSDGIYALDAKVNIVKSFSSRGDTILSLFYKDHVYFVRDGEYKIVRKKDSNFDIYVDDMRVKNFVINKYNVFIFLSNLGLFAKRNKEIVKLSKNAFIRGLTIDLDDVVYAWWVDEVYKVVIDNNVLSKSRLVKIAEIPFIGAITFDNNNNFIFTSDKNLFRLIETDFSNCLNDTDGVR